MIARGQLNLTLLQHVLLLGAQPNRLPVALKANQTLQKNFALQSYHLPILSHNKVTLPLYVFPLLVLLYSLDHAIIVLLSHNRILNNIAKGTTHKPKCFLCCYRSNKNNLVWTHTQRQTCESSYQTQSLISWYKRITNSLQRLTNI